MGSSAGASNDDYLKQKLKYDGDKLLDADGGCSSSCCCHQLSTVTVGMLAAAHWTLLLCQQSQHAWNGVGRCCTARMPISSAALVHWCAGEAVMMGWEGPLMVKHADIICANGGDVLNVGFGLGLIDDEIQVSAERHAARRAAHMPGSRAAGRSSHATVACWCARSLH